MSEVFNVEKIFAKNVFTLGKMKERLPKNVFKEVKKVMDQGGELSLAAADVVAKAMKDWAVENGATHYTHWFQPLTGITAEKHDSFVAHPDEEGRMLMEFSGKELIKGEPDASSFPSGGLRSTFEARGYTAWDITSPAFLKEAATGVILCIPTAFCSYKGEALDKKTPLLRSMEAVSEQALRIVRLFGNTEAKRVVASVGAEQEYFLVDKDKYLDRPDLIFAGRTLFGAPAPKGQELEDHYFGVIRERIGAYMKDLNEELWKLGVTAKTQHNEVAPAQHELAPVYETANIAVDHNQIVMETMKRVAVHHDLRCLLHEKPFAGVNGSGKHNNWSLGTDNGVNLLDPGDTPNENIQFLLVLACILKAVDTHADLLRQSASDVGNDHRLGANEAPPAIISIFLGEQLEDVVKQLVETGIAETCKEGGVLKTGVSSLPDLVKDATDRNRTSPFAFTGNKFEFRMVGSSDSIASPNTTLNAIVAEVFCEAADILEKADDFDLAVHDLIKEYMNKHQRIIFNGDGYSEEWVKEAERRGLPNIKSMVEAIDTLTTDKSVKLFEKFGIFTKAELESREEVLYETYAKTINIEALTMIDMASKQIIPAVMKYTKSLADTVIAVKEAGADVSVQSELLGSISKKLIEMKAALVKLEEIENQAGTMPEGKEQIPEGEHVDAHVKNQRKIVNWLNIALAYTNQEQYEDSNRYLDQAEKLMSEKQMQDLEFACDFLKCQNQYYLHDEKYVQEHLPYLLDGIEELVSVYSYEQNISEMFVFLMKLKDKEKMQRLLDMVERFVKNRPETYYQLMAAKMWMEYEKIYGTEQQYQKSCVRMAELYFETEKENQRERQQNLDLRMEMRKVEAERNAVRQQYEREEKRQKQLLEEALAEAEKANRAKTEFLSKMSHEIRTPLNAVIGYIDMAQNNLEDPDKLNNYHKKSKVAANHLLSIINDVLDVSAIASGHFKVEMQPFHLKQIVSEINTIFRQQAFDKHIFFQIELKNVRKERLVGDVMRVKQIMLNLLSNAIKFTPEQGKITLRIQQIPDKLEHKVNMQFEVQDTGIGMTKEFMDRMFTPFEQQDASISRKYGGTGLGLSISRQLAEMMGGSISVWSREQEGTIFTVEIPFDVVPELEEKEPHNKVGTGRALVVNGDRKAALETKELLKELGIPADIAGTREKALRQMKLRQGGEYGYDLCLLEEQLQDGSGMNLAHDIHTQYGDQVMILLLAEVDSPECVTEAAESGVSSVIEKPLFLSDLRRFLLGAEQEGSEDESDSDKVDLAGLHVILAEDNEMNMEIAEDILKRAGLTIDKAENGEKALALFAASEPDTYQIILMDIQMPVMDGYEAARAIRCMERPDAEHIPIIALTANAFTEDVHRALEAGMNGHIAKPIHIQALYRLMGKLANRHEGD